jgi:signal peptidase I
MPDRDRKAMRVLKYFGGGLAVAAMTAAALTLLLPRFGWHIDTMMSGSMAPAIQVGSVVVTAPVDASSITRGNVITFRSPLTGELTSHRVEEVITDAGTFFRTKGDANEDTDPVYATWECLVGKVCFSLPYVGYLTHLTRGSWGLLLLILPGLAIIIMELRTIWQEATGIIIEKRYRINT